MSASRMRVYAAVGGALVLAALVAVLAAGHATGWADRLEDALEQRGLLQGMAIFTAATVVGTLLMVPAWIFPIAAGAAFGFGWGLAASIVAQAAAAQCAFLLARHGLKRHVERIAKKQKSFKAVDTAVKKDPWKVIALLRLAPVLPSGMKSYLLGLTCAGALDYATASAAGTLPALALKVYIGAAGRDALTAGGPLRWAVLGFGVAATLALAFFAGRAAKRTLKL